jgi:hypothetical protein
MIYGNNTACQNYTSEEIVKLYGATTASAVSVAMAMRLMFGKVRGGGSKQLMVNAVIGGVAGGISSFIST